MAKLPSVLSSLFETSLINEINRHAECRTFETGSILIESGEQISCVPIVVKGTIKITKQDEQSEQEVFLYYLREGDSCVAAFKNQLTPTYSSIRATAEEKTTVLILKKELIADWFLQYPDWRTFVLRTYQQRFDNLLGTVSSIAFKRLDERLWEYLMEKFALVKGRCIYVRHIDIAFDLNVSREAVSRLLKRLKNSGLVLLSRNKICLANTV
jgi:CRP/FNR family transcriptional regulator